MPNPNQMQPLRPIDQAIAAADKILEHLGTASPDLQRMKATVSIDNTSLTEVPESAIPIITIDKPIGPYAKDKAQYILAVGYGAQDGKTSRHIVIPKDGSKPRIQSQDGGHSNAPGKHMVSTRHSVDRKMTTKEEIELARDLSKIAEL